MTKKIKIMAFGALMAVSSMLTTAAAAPVVVENFDNVAIGTTWKVWDRWGNPVSTTATVIADPKNSSNHVLKVTVKGWNQFPEFIVPTEYKGANLAKNFKTIRFRFYRPTSDQNDYKQMHVFFGSDVQYDDNGGYPFQGDKNVWQQRSYDIVNVPATSTATALHLGIHCDVSEYYIDDIMLYGEFDDYKSYDTGELNLCSNNTASSYVTYTTPTFIPADTKLDFYAARYMDIYAPFAGEGTLNLYCGGERVYMGEHSGRKYADWTKFTGDVHVYKYNKVVSNAGFYGLVMGHNGKTFIADDVERCIKEGLVCNSFSNNRVYLHNGATVAFESGTRGALFGELNTEPGSRIMGYMKSSTSANSYVVVGTNNTDATMAGTIAPQTPSSQKLGLIKMGTGTYTLSASDNNITGGVTVRGGRMNNVGTAMKASNVYAMGKGTVGGSGTIAAPVDIYGTLEPGTSTETASLTVKGTGSKLVMHPEGTLRFKIKSAEEYDQLTVANSIQRSTQKENFTTSDDMPTIRVVLTEDQEISAGDEFIVLTAAKRDDADNWKWNIKYPTRYTWKADELRNEDGTYSLRLTVTSLEDDPANSGNDNTGGNEEEEDEISTRVFKSDGTAATLRQKAEEKGVRIGVAVATYRIDLSNYNDPRTQAIKNEFDMVVNENELKWESCEPSQNSFEYGGGDNLLYFANNNRMSMRGHTLAWHSQVAQWVSADGKKNDKGWTKAQLMAILKNHITKVVGHYKGKVREWDVVNECLDDDQSSVRTNPGSYTLRKQSIWTTVCGEEFIDSAFVWAHRADPSAKLYLNDYGQETMGLAKTEAFFNLAKRLQRDGIPIDGVGFQCHLDAANADAKAIAQNIARYDDLGFETAITELDLGIDLNNEEQRQVQARAYYRIVSEVLKQSKCRSIVLWGLTDDLSWRQSNPLLWNGSTQKKPAYYGVRDALNEFVPFVKGDVNHDGNVDSIDAKMIVLHTLGIAQKDFDATLADVNGDAKISIADANMLINTFVK